MVYISFTVAKKDRSVWKPGKNKDTLSPQSELDYAQFDQITRRRGTLLQESYLCVFDCVWTDNISTGRAFILTLRLQHHRARLTFSFLFFFWLLDASVLPLGSCLTSGGSSSTLQAMWYGGDALDQPALVQLRLTEPEVKHEWVSTSGCQLRV